MHELTGNGCSERGALSHIPSFLKSINSWTEQKRCNASKYSAHISTAIRKQHTETIGLFHSTDESAKIIVPFKWGSFNAIRAHRVKLSCKSTCICNVVTVQPFYLHVVAWPVLHTVQRSSR